MCSRTLTSPLNPLEAEPITSSDAVRHTFIDLLRDGYWIRSPARANSMSLLIRKGDRLTVKPLTFGEAAIGDILAYRRDPALSVLTTHRMIQKGRDGEGPFIITKGDQSLFRDPPIRCPTHVYGKVVCVERNGRLIFLETPFRRLLGYFRARLSLGAWSLRSALAAPHLLPVRVLRRILGPYRES